MNLQEWLKEWIATLDEKTLNIEAAAFVIVCAVEGVPLCVSSTPPDLMHQLIHMIQDGITEDSTLALDTPPLAMLPLTTAT